MAITGASMSTSPFATGGAGVQTPTGTQLGGTQMIPIDFHTNPFAITTSGGSQSTGESTGAPAVVQTPQSEYSLRLAKAAQAQGDNVYNWAGQNYDWLKGIADQAIPQFLQGAASSDQLANLQLSQYENMYAPAMSRFNELANSYSSPERQRYAMGQAEADATGAANASWQNTRRDLQSMGIDPSSGMYAGLKSAAETASGASAAGAANQARQNVENTGIGLQEQNINWGMTTPASAMNALNTGAGLRSAAVNTGESTANTGANLYNTADQFYNTAAAANKLPTSGQQTQSTQQQTAVTPGSTTMVARGGLIEPDDGYRRGGRVKKPKQPQGGGGGGATGDPAPQQHMIANGDGSFSNLGFNYNGPGWSTGGWGQQTQTAKNPSLPMAPAGGAPAGGLPTPPPSGSADSGMADNAGGIPDAGAAARGGPMDPAMPQPHGHQGRPHPPHPYHTNGLPDAATGGHVPYELSPSHGHTTDDVVANLNAGEFVLPRRTVHHLGHKALYKLIADADKEMGLHPQPVGPQKVKPGSGAGQARSAAESQNFLSGGGI